jgi:hypothetical protein
VALHVRSLKLSIEYQKSESLVCLEGRPRLRAAGPRALRMSRMIRELSTESQKVEKQGIEVSIT